MRATRWIIIINTTWIRGTTSSGRRLGGCNAVFANLAGLAGPVPGKPDSMMAVNYRAPVAAARACEALGSGISCKARRKRRKRREPGRCRIRGGNR